MSKPVIAVAIYSTYGHVAKLGQSVIKGLEAAGATVKPFVFQETLSDEIRGKMHAAPLPDYPVLTPDDLKKVDGLVIGAPTRYGRVPAQVSAFFDACGGLWMSGALVGMPVTQFTSAASQHGGHETTAVTTFPFYAHQGMIYVPPGFSIPELSAIEQIGGGSAYGASTTAAGDGHLQPTETDLKIAEHQGSYFGKFVSQLKRGKELIAADSAQPSETVTAAATPAAKSVPEQEKQEGYAVPASSETTAAPTRATTTAAPTGASTPAPAPKAATEKPAAPAAAPAKKEKKGGLFSCCGDRGIDH